MTQCDEKSIAKAAEFNVLFRVLDQGGQECALHIMRTLEFAQSILCDQPRKPSGQRT